MIKAPLQYPSQNQKKYSQYWEIEGKREFIQDNLEARENHAREEGFYLNEKTGKKKHMLYHYSVRQLFDIY